MSMHESIFFMYMLYVVNLCLCDASVTGAELIAADGCRRSRDLHSEHRHRKEPERKRKEGMLEMECLLSWFQSSPLDVHRTLTNNTIKSK